MANKDDYLTEYRQFFENFANSVEPNDQLPVKLGSYKFINTEVVGGIVDWCLQYLSRKSCPSSLVAPLIKTTIDEIRQACKKHPVACGFIPNDNVYEPFKLMQTVIRKMNEVCLRYLDNSQLDNLPAPDSTPLPQVSVCASRNARRRMEDRHVIIHDINTMFNIQDSSPSSYYAIFDGHAGPDAASYSAAHLHQFIAESQYYPTDPQRALKEAFLKTDEFFLDKAKIENFRSGTTAVCALLRPKQQTLYVAWVGDSQALLVNRGNVLQIVKPHKPSREDEKVRIESEGGCVMYWGMWRVNGQLAVSRAIGDLKLKPYVIADPDVAVVPLDGNEEFLIMACDGLWDFVSEDDAAVEVYNRVRIQPDNIEDIAEHLVNLAKKQGSRDNISVVVIFLKDPKQIVRKLPGIFGWTTETGADMDNSNNATNNAFDLFDVFQKKNTEGFMDCAGAFKQNGTVLEEKQESDLYFMERPTNGKRNANEFDEYEEDLGPETDVDAIDDVLLSSTIAKAKAIAEGIDNNNPEDEQMVLDVDMELNKQQHTDFNTLMEQREETPTPPADSVRDSSGIADNVAESGEDSEDEWNYYRVDPKKENSPPIETIVKVSEQEHLDLTAEEMSQLNPDAAEFVPVSPTRNVTSPAFNRDILDDKVITQSPRRAVPMDINVPSPVEFQSEVKQRPSEVFEELENHENKNGHQMSSQELMQNFLNGKDINEIEFHPTNFAKNVSDIPNDNFICENKNVNSNDELNMSGVMETVSSPIDTESHDENDFANNFVRNKEQDPMSMSFYQDKDEEGTGFSTNPFDLNKVQMLPNDDELNENNINQPPELPEHIETAETIFSKDIIDIKENEKTENQELLCDLSKSPALEVHSPSVELSSPAGPLSPKSPIPELTDLVSPDITASIKDEHVDDISKSPAFSQHSTATPIDNILKSPETECDVLIHQHPDLSHSPNINEETRSSHSPNVHEELHMSPSPIVHEEPHLSPSPIVHEEPHLSPSPNIHEQPHLSPSPNIHEQPHLSPSPNVHQEPHLSPSPNVHEEPHLSPSPNVHEQPHLSPSPNMIEESKISSIQQENLVDTATDLMSDFVKVAQNEITDILSNVIEHSSTIVDEISQEAIETISEQTSEITHDVEKSGHQFIDNFENEMKDDFNEKIIDLDNVVKEVERDTANYMEDACKFVNKFQDDVNVMNGNVINNFGVEMNQQINLIENELQAVKADTLEDTKEITEKIEHDFDEKVNEICQNTVEEVSHVSKETENLVENQILDQISNVTEIVNTLTDLGDKIENIKEETNQIFDNFMEKSNNLSESLMLDNKESEFIVKPIIPEISTEVKTQIEQLESWKCEYPLKTPEEIHIEQPIDIKHEIITPEYPVPTITSPLEETKGLETPPTTPAVQTTDIEMKSPEPQKIVEAIETLTEVTNAKEQESTVESMKVTEVVEAVTATAALAATAVAATATAKKTPAKPKNTTTTTKKPLPSKTSPMSPTKPLVSKTSTTVKKTTTTTTKPASAPTKTSTTTVKQTKTPTASPKPATTLSKTSTARPKSMTTTAKTSIEKKPLTNGDVKTPATKPPPIRKLTNGTTTKPTTTTEKLSPSTTKPPISKTTATATARATTAPTKPARSTLPSSTITSKPKSATTKTPTGTTSKTTTNTTNVKSTVTSTVNRTLTATKPKTTTLSSKPKTTVTSTKPAAKAPDTEKQIKETVNKNISASKLTATKPSSTTRTSTTLKKVEAKVPSARSTTTRTTTTTIKSTAMGKKPSEVSKTTITKTTNVSAKVPVKQQNGVDVIQEITTVTVVSEEPHLVKDNSPIDTPIVVDNSQLIDTAIIAD